MADLLAELQRSLEASRSVEIRAVSGIISLRSPRMPEDDPLDAVAEALQGCIGFFSVSYAEGFLEALEDEGYTVVRKEANG